MATTETYAPNRLYTIPLAELMPDPNQPRKYFDPVALEELTASIAQNGVMSPIFFRVENGLKYIVAGERWRIQSAGPLQRHGRHAEKDYDSGQENSHSGGKAEFHRRPE